MNILYISNEYPPETGFGGIGTYTMHSAEGMAERGHSVHVISRSLSLVPSTTFQNGVLVHRISPGAYPLPSQRIFYPFRKLCYSQIPTSLVRLAWAREAFRKYRELTETNVKFDLIEYPDCGGEGFFFSGERAVSRVVRLHTPWKMVRTLNGINESSFDRALLDFIERKTVKAATAITSPTTALAEVITAQWHIEAVKVFPNPLPISDTKRVLGKDWIFTGRVEYRKGVHLLIEAYARLCQVHALPRLRLIGAPYGRLSNGTDYGDFIQKLIDDHECKNKIEWVKGVRLSSIPGYLRQSSVAIFPSIWENLSYSCLEAMSFGIAVVASRCGGFPEIIDDGQNGLMFEPGNVGRLMERLLSLHTNPLRAQSMGNAARQTIETVFNSRIVCATMENFYDCVRQGRVHGKY
jgi:glycosyltransferase involved in cell wall biosynthesis